VGSDGLSLLAPAVCETDTSHTHTDGSHMRVSNHANAWLLQTMEESPSPADLEAAQSPPEDDDVSSYSVTNSGSGSGSDAVVCAHMSTRLSI
jgi:hypothetical protein